MNYSVLMSVYFREQPEFLAAAVESMFCQTCPSNDIVLMCDGPLTDELDRCIDSLKEKYGDIMHVVRLPKNQGLGNALNEGMKLCKNDLIARMDSDDIAYPDRCEKQLKIFSAHPETDICSGIVEEFSGIPENVTVRRVPPETNEEIHEFVKKRNPFNHPCVMYRKTAVETVGGYRDFYLLEDYYLWIRMLMNGCKAYNIQEPLLHMRAGSDMYKRRAGRKYAASQRALFRYMKDEKLIGFKGYACSCVIRTLSAMAPNYIREKLFRKFLRKV